MTALLSGFHVVEVGSSDSVRFCGRLLAGLGADVVSLRLAGSKGAIASREMFDAYLDQKKHIRLESALSDQAVLAAAVGSDVVVLGSEVRRYHGLPEGLLADGISCVFVTPFGLTGTWSGRGGGDLIASHAGGYAYYLTTPSPSPEQYPPVRGPEGQALLFAGVLAAVAALNAALRKGRDLDPVVLDLSEQEAVASLLFEELGEYNEGKLPGGRVVTNPEEGSRVAGGLVGLLPCSDGFVMLSAREQHQWERVIDWLGQPEWAASDRYATPELRIRNWVALQGELSLRTRVLPKRQVFIELQSRKVACFPVNTVSDVLASEQLMVRDFWEPFPPKSGVVVPTAPYGRLANTDRP